MRLTHSLCGLGMVFNRGGDEIADRQFDFVRTLKYASSSNQPGVNRMIEIDGGSLTLEQTERVADGEQVSLSATALPRIDRGRRFVEEVIARGEFVYGI